MVSGAAPSESPARPEGGDPEDPRWDSAFARAFARPPEEAPPATIGRFEVLEEIGRGGNGRVYAARDPRLDREVAVKVLRPELRGSAEAVRRLLAEAQMGARMQHPGTLPVHEVGVSDDGSPFVVLPRIRGRSLAELLAARPSVEHGRERFLEMALALARALAYAHSRGVTHRDVKPANVMVGAFGEVQLVDWGLAKAAGVATLTDEEGAAVLGGAVAGGSLPGSVLGTPRYMAPEQARGDLSAIGPRTDVFAWGGLLAELLCGQAPYPGEPSQALVDAAAARLEPLRAALTSCAADPALVRLAQECLAPDPASRPADASVIVVRLEAYLAEREQRVRAAEVEAGAARERALGERRRRRLAWALAGTVALGAATVLIVERARASERRQHQEAAARTVSAALLTAAERRARAEGTLDAAAWDAAAEAARAAAQAARETEGVDTGPVDALVREAEAGLARVRAAEEQRRLDREMMTRFAYLEAYQVAPGDAGLPHVDHELEQVFAAYGLTPDRPPDAAFLQRCRDAGLGDRVAQGLWAWARVRRGAGGDGAPVLALAARFDPDPVRIRIRSWTTPEEVHAGAAALGSIAALPAATHTTLAKSLWVEGRDTVRAAEVAGAAARAHPDDAHAQLLATTLFTELDPPRLDEALASAIAAVALRPTSAGAWAVLSELRVKRGEHEAAFAAARRSLRIAPAWSRAREAFAAAGSRVGEAVRACEVVLPLREEGVRVSPASAWHRRALGNAYGGLGRYADAARELSEALRLDPALPGVHGPLARSLLMLRSLDAAREHAVALRDADAGNPFAHRFLGEVLLASGRYEEALGAFDAAAQRLEGTDAEFAERLDALRRAAGRRRAVARGEDPGAAASLADALDTAEALDALGQRQAAGDSVRAALQAQPLPPGTEDAADALAQGAALLLRGAAPDAGGAAGREQARGLLRQALDLLDPAPHGALPAARLERLVRWRGEQAFATARGTEALSLLPASEQAAWAALWADADAACARPLPDDPGFEPSSR